MSWWLQLKDARSLLTKEWFPIPAAVDCPVCGAQTRLAAIVIGPSALVNDAGFKADDFLSEPWKRLDGDALMERRSGCSHIIERFVVDRFHASFVMKNGSPRSICEHFHKAIPAASIRAAAMNTIVRLGARRLLVKEGLLTFFSDVELTEFRSGTTIREDRLPHSDSALMLIYHAESPAGETGTVELLCSIARGDYALIIGCYANQEMPRDDVSGDLANVVEVNSDLGLVLTEPHLAKAAAPSVRSLALSPPTQYLTLATAVNSRSKDMQNLRAVCLVSTFTACLAGCASVNSPPRPLPPSPYTYLSLADCKRYGSAIVDCQMEYGTVFARHRLGSVQQTGRGYAAGHDHRYQVASCVQAPRIQKELPNYICQIYGVRSGAEAGPVLVKGGTAVRLAKVLGDQEQIRYRWTADRWSRVRD